MKIVVTGGAGFIASHIVDAYIQAGHEVVVIDNLSTGNRSFISSEAHFYEADIRDSLKMAAIFEKEKPVLLNHHAAQMDVRKSVADPVFDAQVNIIGLLNLLEAGRHHGLKKVIFASSGGAIYGDSDRIPTPETNPVQPASPYGVSKLTTEYYLHVYFSVYNISYVALRYGNVYGPRQNPHGEAGVVAIFTQKMLRKEQPVINGDGKQIRDFVYVKDVVAANLAALTFSNPLIVNIGTGIQTDINTVYQRLTRLTGFSSLEKHGSAKQGEQRISCLNAQKATKLLHWKPTVTLDQGLAATVSYFAHEKQTEN